MGHQAKEFAGKADVRGWKFRQVRRSIQMEDGAGKPVVWAMYERTRGDDACYEVVRIRQFAVDKVLNGRQVATKGDEYYPPASKWGLDGFSYRLRHDAEAAYMEKIA